MKKTLALLLALLLLLPTLAACAEKPAQTDPTETAETADTPDENSRPMHNVPQKSFRGAAFTMISYGQIDSMFADDWTGETMNDAVYKRQTAVEDYLDVDIGYDIVDGIKAVHPAVQQSVLASDDQYQLVLTHCIAGNASLVTDNLLYDFEMLPVVDFDADWWNLPQMDRLRLGEKYYYGVSDTVIPFPYAIFFNRDILDEYQMDDPYTLVYNGTWTLDKYLDMASAAKRDLNGDGQMDRQDLFGMGCGEGSRFISFITGSGQYLTGRSTETDRIELVCNTEKMQKLIELFARAAQQDGMIRPFENEDMDTLGPDFESGHILFCLDSIGAVKGYAGYDIGLGLVPYPKYDEAQENYLSLDWGGLMSVPVTIRDPEMVGSVLELMAYLSEETVIPAYFTKTLDGRYARDVDMRNMIHLLFDTITYETGGNYFGFDGSFMRLFYAISELAIADKSTNYASLYKKYSKTVNNMLKDFYKKLSKNEMQ